MSAAAPRLVQEVSDVLVVRAIISEYLAHRIILFLPSCLSAHWSPCSTPSLLPRLRAQTAAAGHRIQERDSHHVSELHLISILLHTCIYTVITNPMLLPTSHNADSVSMTWRGSWPTLRGRRFWRWLLVEKKYVSADYKKSQLLRCVCMYRGYWWRCVPVVWCTCGPSWAHTPGSCVGETSSMKCKLSQSLSISCISAPFCSHYSKPCLRLMQ